MTGFAGTRVLTEGPRYSARISRNKPRRVEDSPSFANFEGRWKRTDNACLVKYPTVSLTDLFRGFSRRNVSARAIVRSG